MPGAQAELRAGQRMPPEIVVPRPGQESVWDYPRPPRLEKVVQALCVTFAGETIAQTVRGYRVLETSHPPVYYFPPDDVRWEFLLAAPGKSFCEFKGCARYWSIEVKGERSDKAAWSYPQPNHAYQPIRHHIAFYPSRVGACSVGGERVQAQPGDFYGGWITSRVVGPFKGSPGTLGW